MKFDRNELFLRIYVSCALFTFGYSYNVDYRYAPTITINGQPFRDEGMESFGNLLASGMKACSWPLYWSVVMFQSKRPVRA